MLDDVRYALRGMVRSPGFTAVALLMIALGTGANAAMFSVIDGVMLQSPFTDPGRIGVVRVIAPGRGATAGISIPQYRSLAAAPGPFEAVAAIGGGTRPMLAGLGETRRFNDECITAGMFRVLGTPPLLGRVFTDDDDRPGAPGVVVLSYDFWTRELGGSADVLGRNLTIDGMPATIIGVMPRRFAGPYSRNSNDGWMPLGPAFPTGASPGCRLPGLSPAFSVVAFVRLAAGASFDGAAAQATVSAGIERIPTANGTLGAKLTVMPIEEQTFDEVRTPLFALLGAVGLVLLIACANVANLQLERVFGRRRELAVRMAIGATRARVVRQTLTENVLLYAVGCAAGVLIARWTLDLIVGLMPGYIPHLNDIEIDVRVLAATFAVSLAAGLLVGVVPALQASSPSLIDDLRVSFRTATPAGIRMRRVLVVAQLALSLTLVVGAALMVRTFLTLRPSNPGFTTRDKVTASVRLQGPRATDPAVFFDALLDRVGRLPGVQGVTASSYLPVSGNIGIATIQTGEAAVEVFSGVVMPNYFEEMQIPVLRGRAFDTRDTRGAPPVVIVNEAFVRRLGARASLGASLVVTGLDRKTETRQIVGIIRDTRSSGGDTRARPELYFAFAQMPYASMNLIVRSANPSDPRLATDLRQAVAAIDPTLVADRIIPFSQLLDARVATWRFGAWLLGVFAAMALLLAAVGLAAAIAWWVTQRTREIGVRMALGANAADVSRMVVRQAAAIAVSGIVLGLAGAAASTRLIASWLYGVTPLDVPTFAWSALGMLGVAIAASYIPVRRAARVDPLVALRAE
jgi:putative ABC transport system permease protein